MVFTALCCKGLKGCLLREYTSSVSKESSNAFLKNKGWVFDDDDDDQSICPSCFDLLTNEMNRGELETFN
jgi:hypothetical protein